jgi:hypothetical protein
MRRPILEKHLQTSPPSGGRGIPPALVGRPWPRPALDPDGRATGDRQSQVRRNRRTSPTPGNPDRCPVRAEDLDRNGRWMDECRGRGREAAWPRWRIPDVRRDHGSSASRADAPSSSLLAIPQASRLGAGGSSAAVLLTFLTPRHEADLFTGPPPTRAYRDQDRLVAEKALNSRQPPFHLSACLGSTSFEIQLASVVGNRLTDREPQQGDPGGGGGDHRPLQPSFELPPDPVHHGSGSERAVPPPPTLQ